MVSGQKNPSARQSRRYARVRKVFAVLLILSACLLLASLLVFRSSGERPPGSVWPSGSEEQEFNTIGIISLLASITSLIGFASTTYLQWREEQREAREAALEQKRTELEIEKLSLELERIKAEREETYRS